MLNRLYLLYCIGILFFFIGGMSCLSSFDDVYSRAQSLEGEGKYAASLKQYQKLMTTYPAHKKLPGVEYRIAVLSEQLMNDDQYAILSHQRIIDKYPLTRASILSRERLVEYAVQYKQWDKAATILQNLMHLDVKNVRYKAKQAQLYCYEGKFDQCSLEFMALLANKELSVRMNEWLHFHYALAVFYSQKEQLPLIISTFKEFNDKFPSSTYRLETMFFLALCYENMGQLGKSKQILEDIQTEYPNPDMIQKRLDIISHYDRYMQKRK